MPTQASAIWLNSNWDYRIKLTVDNTKVGATSSVTNFPVYLNLANLPSDFHTNVKADGCDIRIVEADETTETAFDLVSYSSTTDTGELHFLADSLSSSTPTDFYIYYGKPAATCYGFSDLYGRNNVWTGYTTIHHFQNAASSSATSTTTYDLTTFGSPTYSTSGRLLSGIDLDGVDDNARNTATTYGITNGDITLSVWVKLDAEDLTGVFPQQIDYFVSKEVTGTNVGYFIAYEFQSGTNRVQFGRSRRGVVDNIVNYSVTLGTTNWHKLHMTYSGTTVSGYYNGVLIGTTTSSGNGTTGSSLEFALGRLFNNFYFPNGVFDELRMANNAKNASWIITEYNNQNNPSTFFTIGSQEIEFVETPVFQDTNIRGGVNIRGGAILR